MSTEPPKPEVMLRVPQTKDVITITGIHLVRIGDYAVVRAEIAGRWVDVIREHIDGSFSHIVEPGGMFKAAGIDTT